MDLQAIQVTAEGIALEAGHVLRGLYGKAHQETAKLNMADIVTEGDKASEKVIVNLLRQAFPTHGIISEEGDGADHAPDAEYFWHIDPIDGTTNFSKNLPLFAVSMGLADKNMRPLVGVVYAPILNEMYSAARGFGATLNGEKLSVSQVSAAEQAVLVTGLPVTRSAPEQDYAQIAAMNAKVRALRILGSGTLDLCFVAAGKLEAFWEREIHSWDVMAGLLIVEEAGGKISDWRGQQSETLFSGAEVLASNGLLHDMVLSEIGH